MPKTPKLKQLPYGVFFQDNLLVTDTKSKFKNAKIPKLLHRPFAKGVIPFIVNNQSLRLTLASICFNREFIKAIL